MKKTTIFLLTGLSSFIGVFSSCQQDELKLRNMNLKLGAFIRSESLKTKGEITVATVTKSNFDIPFYIEMEQGVNKNFGIYEIEDGNEGHLISINNSVPLNWLSTNEDHTFYSWTLPWDEDTYSLESETSKSEISFRQDDPMYDKYKGNANLNCRILEKFIGAKAGPVNYKDNGEYVEIQYYHLVSKVRIGSIILIKGNGTTDASITGTFTFIGMPQTAIFDRRPSDNGAPFVKGKNKETGDPMEATYTFGSTQQSSMFYVCPDTDFSKLEFRIHLDKDEYNQEGDYFGNFSQVEFNREDYPGWDDGKDKTVLYAGEMMTLNLTLTQGHGVGVTMSINEWDIAAPQTGTSHSHPGIYSGGEAQSVSNAFATGSSAESIDEAFEMFGDTFGEDKVFPIYEDIDFGQGTFNMGKDYILDGMGHTVKMKPNNNGTSVRIGPCRDIYLTDGEHTIYIDSEGKIYVVNSDGSKTEKGALGDLKGSTYNIDLATGTIK